MSPLGVRSCCRHFDESYDCMREMYRFKADFGNSRNDPQGRRHMSRRYDKQYKRNAYFGLGQVRDELGRRDDVLGLGISSDLLVISLTAKRREE